MAKQVGETTRETATEQAKRTLAEGGHGLPAVVGRLWHSPRRYSWGFRFGEHPTVTTFQDGTRFEAVDTIRA